MLDWLKKNARVTFTHTFNKTNEDSQPPDIFEVGIANDSSTDMSTTYSRLDGQSTTTSHTFHFKAGQKLGIAAEFQAGVLFAKSKTTLSAELSFEEGITDTTQTTTTVQNGVSISTTVPPHKAAVLETIIQKYKVDGTFDVKAVVNLKANSPPIDLITNYGVLPINFYKQLPREEDRTFYI